MPGFFALHEAIWTLEKAAWMSLHASSSCVMVPGKYILPALEHLRVLAADNSVLSREHSPHWRVIKKYLQQMQWMLRKNVPISTATAAFSLIADNITAIRFALAMVP